MTISLPTPTRRPVPDLEAPKLYRAIVKARRDAEEATARATTAYQEAEDARGHLAQLEAQYRAVKRECI